MSMVWTSYHLAQVLCKGYTMEGRKHRPKFAIGEETTITAIKSLVSRSRGEYRPL